MLSSGAISFTAFLHSLPPLLFFLLSFLLRFDADPVFFRAAARAAKVSFRDLLLLFTEGVEGSAPSPKDTRNKLLAGHTIFAVLKTDLSRSLRVIS